jgi:hypothetical protein
MLYNVLVKEMRFLSLMKYKYIIRFFFVKIWMLHSCGDGQDGGEKILSYEKCNCVLCKNT